MNGKEKEIRGQREPECAGICLASGYGWKKSGFRDESREFIRLHDKSQQKARWQTAFFCGERRE